MDRINHILANAQRVESGQKSYYLVLDLDLPKIKVELSRLNNSLAFQASINCSLEVMKCILRKELQSNEGLYFYDLLGNCLEKDAFLGLRDVLSPEYIISEVYLNYEF